MSWDGQNRRQFPRVIYPCLIKLSAKAKTGINILTHTENIGIGGISVTVKHEIKLFSDVEIEIDLLDTADHIKAIGKIVWVVRRRPTENVKPLFYDLGVEFVNLQSKHKEHLKMVLEKVIQNGATVIKQI